MNPDRGTGWEHFHHAADIGVRGIGSSPHEAFEQAALALTAVITEPAGVKPVQSICIHAQAPDTELLFADWLNALIFEMATRHMLFSRFEVQIHGNHLQARAWGEVVDLVRHQPAVEIKAATYSELKVARQDNGLWLAQCIVDV